MNHEISYDDRCCLHEAGHTLLDARGSQSMGALIKDANGGGVARAIPHDNLVSAVASCAAGAIAEWIRLDRKGSRLDGASPADLRILDSEIEKHYKRKMNRECCPEFWRGMQLAEDTIREHWGALLHMARWLKQKQKISGELVHAILVIHEQRYKELANAS